MGDKMKTHDIGKILLHTRGHVLWNLEQNFPQLYFSCEATNESDSSVCVLAEGPKKQAEFAAFYLSGYADAHPEM